MKDNIVKFYQKNAAEDPDVVLEQAIGQYNDVLVLGWDKEDVFDARASLGLNVAETLRLLEVFKFNLLRGDYSE